MEIRASLPIPPSNNRYYRHARGRTYLSAEGRAYKREVAWLLKGTTTLIESVSVIIDIYPKNKKVCDLDNYPKAIFDALTYARAWVDDDQVKDLHIRFSGLDKTNPRIVILISEIFNF